MPDQRMLQPPPNFVEEELFRNILEIVENSGTTFLDAVIHWCERNGLEPELVGAMVAKNPHMRARLQKNAEALHYLRP